MPITRLFRLVCDEGQCDRFASVGEHNLLTSIDVEPGTLSMSASHLDSDPSVNYVFEIYRDEAAYEVHAASGQFLAFADFARTGLTDRAVYTCSPELLLEKEGGLKVTQDETICVRMARLVVPQEHGAAFREAVFANMRASVGEEEGVLSMYAVTLADDASVWYFWEVYASEEAYAVHRETDHFKAYIAATAELTTTRELTPLVADTLVNQGGLDWQA
jgi:quinol monooxygenase YgiN